MELLIKNALTVDYHNTFMGDVYIKDGIISEIGKNLNKSCQAIDGEGYVLLPSFIDMHSHFREPGLTYKEDIYSGSMAALKGGYTAVNLMANTKPVCSNMEVVNFVLDRAKELNLIDIHQAVSITTDLKGESIEHLQSITDTVKFISDDGRGVQNSKVMIDAMLKAKEKNITVISHTENEELSATDYRLAENIMTWRDITLARSTGCKLHLAHVSTKEAMEYIIEEKLKGGKLTCEVTPHHLFFTEAVKYGVNPPLRKQEDVDFLINSIKLGYVDSIATDHAPHSVEDKAKGAPGISGLETAFSTCYTKLIKEGHISLNKLSELMSKNPAEIMGLNKGKIGVGFDGDVVLVDINKSYTVDSAEFASKGKNTPLQGETLWGKVITTIKGGRILYDARS